MFFSVIMKSSTAAGYASAEPLGSPQWRIDRSGHRRHSAGIAGVPSIRLPDFRQPQKIGGSAGFSATPCGPVRFLPAKQLQRRICDGSPYVAKSVGDDSYEVAGHFLAA